MLTGEGMERDAERFFSETSRALGVQVSTLTRKLSILREQSTRSESSTLSEGLDETPKKK